MAVTNPERYMNENDASQVFQTIKSYILSHSGGGGGGGSTSEPDGNYVINRDSSGNISSIVFTALNGTVVTTTFVETSTTKIIVEHTVEYGASTATIKTTTITGDNITTRTTTEPVSQGGD